MSLARTSIDTFHALRGEGYLGEMQQAVLSLIRRYPDRTDRELARLAGRADPNVLRPRRTELYQAGYLIMAGRRRCSVTGRTAMTWRVCTKHDQMELF